MTTAPSIDPNAIYTITKAAKLLEVSRMTVYRAVKAGRRAGGIQATVRKDNGRIQIKGSELLRYWEGR